MVSRFEPTILKSEAFAPLSESEPVNEPEDMLTLIVPMTVPEGAPAAKELFDRVIDEIAGAGLSVA